MSDSVQMFQTLMQAFCRCIARANFGDIRRLVTLAWAVVGLCLTKSANFSHWGEGVISQAQSAQSHQRRFKRWLFNERVQVERFYQPLLAEALRDWSPNQRLYVALDTSDLGNGYILIRTGLIYRGRALPIAWRVFQHNSTTVGYDDYQGVLHQTLRILPQGARVVFLADRGFVHRKLMQFAHQNQAQVRLRAKASTLVRFQDRRVATMAHLCPPKGHVHCYQDVYILDDQLGPVNLVLANPEDDEEPWYIITDERADLTTLADYALRFDLEENFLDDKSNGFQVEASRLDDAVALERLFLVLAVATLHFTSVGVGVVQRKLRRWVDPHWDRGMSYFKIGWHWLRQQFRRNWPVLCPFWLDPAPDPQPAMASRRQAAHPKRHWVLACFGSS